MQKARKGDLLRLTQHARYGMQIGGVHIVGAIEIGFSLRAFFSQNMAFKSTPTLDQALFHLEAFGCPTIGFHLRHVFSFLLNLLFLRHEEPHHKTPLCLGFFLRVRNIAHHRMHALQDI